MSGKNNDKRILLLIPALNVEGAERVMTTLANEQPKENDETILLLSNNTSFRKVFQTKNTKRFSEEESRKMNRSVKAVEINIRNADDEEVLIRAVQWQKNEFQTFRKYLHRFSDTSDFPYFLQGDFEVTLYD